MDKQIDQSKSNASSVIGQIFSSSSSSSSTKKIKKIPDPSFAVVFRGQKSYTRAREKKKKVEEIRILNVTYIPYFC